MKYIKLRRIRIGGKFFMALNRSTWIFIFAMLLISSCNEPAGSPSHGQTGSAGKGGGEMLAKRYCQSCHAFPEPRLLDAATWGKSVLPNMGPRLGIFSFHGDAYPSLRFDDHTPPGYYPAQPALKPEEWQAIIDYYRGAAPDSPEKQHRPFPIRNELSLFKIFSPPVQYQNPATCFIRIDSSTTAHTLLQSDANRKVLERLDGKLRMIDSLRTNDPVLDIIPGNDQMIACDVGMMDPNNGKFGKLEHIVRDASGKMPSRPAVFVDALQRPVQVVAADLNADGRTDYLVCEFGQLSGALSWYEQQPGNHFQRHVLRAFPGAIRASVLDYNHDGLPDVVALFAQGEEGIFLFTNKGHGQFSSEEILRFPPVYGSSYFELDDFNHDGFPDILYTCGDNADFSPILKPYHGIYIFLNDRHWHFTQKYFFPVNGCYKAMARDFDGDGDLDIASISFFADYAKQPEEGFVYLENTGNFVFRPHSLPATAVGRWLTMDVGDLDGDGKPDIVLGNFSAGPGFAKSMASRTGGPSFLFLKNTGK